MFRTPWFKTFFIVIMVFVSYTLGTNHGKLMYANAQVEQGEYQPFTSLPVDDFAEAASSGEYSIIDIRTLEEYQQGYIPSAVQIDYYQTTAFLNYLDSLDKNKKYLIYCRSGNRTAQALQIMKERGFRNVWDLSNGINMWKASNYPVQN